MTPFPSGWNLIDPAKEPTPFRVEKVEKWEKRTMNELLIAYEQQNRRRTGLSVGWLASRYGV